MLILREPEIATSEILEAEIRGAILRLKNGKKIWSGFHQRRDIRKTTQSRSSMCFLIRLWPSRKFHQTREDRSS